ncbi:hypothetical protein N798_03120 [Knoellia flava TL1]|uniref:Uncharacterized protein n=2 Tax=Knoellia flava TaxID=913969 RepID=A0A8H9FU72_9MICO|nr:hypothetical protein [Knoellia flava]KGN35326.1 hypothetical protein N798_03120 [Knoellia flava TL1]GGB78329.1 hypothetical protein GCM10011314_17520 [Knoellia flava]
MSDDLVIDAFGVRWALRLDGADPDVATRLTELWQGARSRGPDVRTVDPDGSSDIEIFHVGDVPRGSAGHRLSGSEPPATIPYAVSRALTLASIGRRRGSALMLHAAGLSLGPRAVALVGPSGTGKSTASRELGRHFGYLSDETVVLEDDRRVSPYRKPISVVTTNGSPWDKAEFSPAELGLREADTAYLEALVILERDPAREVPELTTLPLIDALVAVIPESSSLPMVERPLQRLAEAASRSGGPYVLRYSEIGDCVDLVADLLAPDGAWTSAAPRAPWSTTPPPDPAPAADVAADGVDDLVGERLVRRPWRDVVHGEDGTLLLIGDRPVRLGPVGEAIWHRAEQPLTRTEAVEAVIDALGPHPDATAIVAEGVAALLDSGVLRPVR